MKKSSLLFAGAMFAFGNIIQAEEVATTAENLQVCKLIVKKDVKERKGKTGIVPTFVYGEKRFCFNTHRGGVDFSNPGRFSIYVLAVSKKQPAFTIQLSGYIKGIGSGYPYKGVDKAQGVISVDDATKTVIFTKEYYYNAEKTATFVCKINNEDKGKIKIVWNTGLTSEQLKTLPKQNDFVLALSVIKKKYNELGVTCNGKELKFATIEELKASTKPESWARKMILQKSKANIQLFSKSPESTISFVAPPGFNTRIEETMWYNPKRESVPGLGIRMSKQTGPSGSLIINLGK